MCASIKGHCRWSFVFQSNHTDGEMKSQCKNRMLWKTISTRCRLNRYRVLNAFLCTLRVLHNTYWYYVSLHVPKSEIEIECVNLIVVFFWSIDANMVFVQLVSSLFHFRIYPNFCFVFFLLYTSLHHFPNTWPYSLAYSPRAGHFIIYEKYRHLFGFIQLQ